MATLASTSFSIPPTTLNQISVAVDPQPLIAEAKEIEPKETLQQMAERVSLEYKIPSTSLKNLIKCESNWDKNADNGKDRGIVQINRPSWPKITDLQAFDPEFSMRFAAEKISLGQDYMWTCGNCYSYAVSQLGKLPKMSEINGNTEYPVVGGLLIIYFDQVKHIAVILKVVEAGVMVSEAEYEDNLITTRLVTWKELKERNATYFRLPTS